MSLPNLQKLFVVFGIQLKYDVLSLSTKSVLSVAFIDICRDILMIDYRNNGLKGWDIKKDINFFQVKPRTF